MPRVLIITPFDLIATAFQTLLADQNISTVCISDISEGPSNSFVPQIIFLDDASITENTQLEDIQKQYPNSKIVILSLTCQPLHVRKFIKAGAIGYLYLHDRLVPRLLLIVEDILNGGTYLSPTAQTALTSVRYYHELRLTDYQTDVLCLMIQHYTASQIADELGRSTGAIYQVQRILREIFVVETNSQLVKQVISLQLLENLC